MKELFDIMQLCRERRINTSIGMVRAPNEQVFTVSFSGKKSIKEGKKIVFWSTDIKEVAAFIFENKIPEKETYSLKINDLSEIPITVKILSREFSEGDVFVIVDQLPPGLEHAKI